MKLLEKIPTYTKIIGVFLALSLTIISCQKKDFSDTQGIVNEGEVTFISSAENAARLNNSNLNTAFPVVKLGNENLSELKSADSSFGYYYLAAGDLLGPSIWGNSLKGTDIEINGDIAYLGYHIPGNVYGGAIDVVDISDPEDPQLLQTVLFADMDILSIEVNGLEIYVSGSRDTEVLTELNWAGAVAKASLDFSGKLIHGTIEYASIPGAVATEVTHTAALIYAVTVGPSGGVQIVNKANMQHVASIDQSNARSIAMDPFGAGYFLLHKAGPADADIDFYPLGIPNPAFGYNVPFHAADESRTAMELSQTNPFLAIANGVSGVTVHDKGGGAIIDFVPLPTTLLGVNPADIKCNDVAWDGDMLYAANGGGGLQVGKSYGGLLAVYGSVPIGESANAVAANDDAILVLGADGLKIFYLEKIDFSPAPPPIPIPAPFGTERMMLTDINFGTLRTGSNQAHHFMGETEIATLDVNSESHFSFDGNLKVMGIASVRDAVLESKGQTTFRESLAIDENGAYIVSGDVVIDGDFYFQGKVIFQNPGSSLQVFGKVYKGANAEVINGEYNLGTKL